MGSRCTGEAGTEWGGPTDWAGWNAEPPSPPHPPAPTVLGRHQERLGQGSPGEGLGGAVQRWGRRGAPSWAPAPTAAAAAGADYPWSGGRGGLWLHLRCTASLPTVLSATGDTFIHGGGPRPAWPGRRNLGEPQAPCSPACSLLLPETPTPLDPEPDPTLTLLWPWIPSWLTQEVPPEPTHREPLATKEAPACPVEGGLGLPGAGRTLPFLPPSLEEGVPSTEPQGWEGAG